MSDKTGIEWTDATWNPIAGCEIVSPGCKNCYAMKQAHALERRFGSKKYSGLTKVVNGNAVWNGVARFDEDALLQPLRWKRPRRIFVNSMSDLFWTEIPEAWVDRVFGVMALAPQHTFQVLTKRADWMREYINSIDRPIAVQLAMGDALNVVARDIGQRYAIKPDRIAARKYWPLPNVWLGVSAEDQQRADQRIPDLMATPASKRFLSAEPLLGPIDLVGDGITKEWKYYLEGGGLDWVIAGGESGSKARPMHPQWARQIRDDCRSFAVPFFFKQNGEFVSVSEVAGPGGHFKFPDGATVRRTGKKLAGATLDGREWREFPT